MKMRRALVLTVLPLIAWAGLIASSSPARAAGHWTSGTYQVFVQGQPFGTWVLFRGGGLAPYDVAGWSVQKNVVTVTSYLPPLRPEICFQYVRAFGCTESMTFTGHKTSDGIASRNAPGFYTIDVNSTVIGSSSFYAVRAGNVPRSCWAQPLTLSQCTPYRR